MINKEYGTRIQTDAQTYETEQKVHKRNTHIHTQLYI
jgi:hypothetical protein